MAIFKCKMCGGDLAVRTGETVCECDYCGAHQTVSSVDDDIMVNLFNRANNLRIKSEFDKAQEIYEKIVSKKPNESEAYWGIVLCKYGIEYVEDPSTFNRVPTCHRTQIESVLTDVDYISAIENADSFQKAVYEKEAKTIDRLQKDILSIAEKEEPFDVFICYKETDVNGKRTIDSVLANDIYYQLTQEGFKVFYSAITLEDKLGQEYEPYIFSALNSAKVMIVVGTKPEYFNAVWVKNEWSRYLKIVKNDRSKLLIPCYRDMDAYDLPEEFSHLQAQDMSKIGFMNDVIRGIHKLLLSEKQRSFDSERDVIVYNESIRPLLKRVHIFLEDAEWDRADDFCEKILNIDPELSEVYLCKLMVEFKCNSKESLNDLATPISTSKNYSKIIRYGSEEERFFIESVAKQINLNITARNELEKEKSLKRQYENAVEKFETAKIVYDYYTAIKLFEEIKAYKDSAEKIEECKTLLLEFYRIEELECSHCGKVFSLNQIVTEPTETVCPYCQVAVTIYPFDNSSEKDEYVDVICPNCDEVLSYTKDFIATHEESTCPFCNKAIIF